MKIDSDFSNWRILVVDDEPDNLDLLADVLEFKGATVAKAQDGRRGLRMVDEFKPNIILLDLMMPDFDGWEMHKQLRARPELRYVPIIAVTALVLQNDVKKALAAGFDGYITKPYRIKALLDDLVASVLDFVKHGDGSHQRPSSVENNSD